MKYKFWLSLIVGYGLLLALFTSTESHGAKDPAQAASLSAQVVRASGPAAAASAPAAQASGQTPFTMVIMNDPQIGWSTNPICLKLDWTRLLNGDEQDDCESTDNECSSMVEFKYRAQAIANVRQLNVWPTTITLTQGGGQVQQPVAVVINGDLTDYFHDYQYELFRRYYVEGLGSTWMLPGLGNHDYSNNVGDCGWPDNNSCAKTAVNYIRKNITGATDNFPAYWVQNFHWEKNMGSLAYSWEYGDYHFVQLHNKPHYARVIDDYEITPSIQWLERDLARATASGKKIVINVHQPVGNWNNQASRDILRTNNVVALFEGHTLSGSLGYKGDVDGGQLHNAFGDDIPTFQAGHAGKPDCNNSDKFLLVEFGDTYMNVGTIDTYTNANSQPGQSTFFQPDTAQHLATYTYTINTPPTNPPYSFLAVGVPHEDVTYNYEIHNWPGKQYNDAGAVNVLYHTEHGEYYQNWVQGNLALYTPEPGVRHGYTLATGDFNHDGYPDLAAGSPQESIPGPPNDQEGIVSVVYGSPTGLHGSILWYGQNSPGDKDKFGSALAVGDFNGDGYDDLAVGVPYKDIEGKGNDAGVVNIFHGGPHGLSAGSRTFKEDDVQFPAPDSNGSERDDRFGFALAAGDFNGDGRDDLAVGAPGEDIEVPGWDLDDGGRVHIFYGGAAGVTATGSRTFEENHVPGGKSEGDDRFGSALAAGDFSGDGRDDLAVGAPGEDIEVPRATDHNDGGRMHIFYGGTGGLTATGSRTFSQDNIPVSDGAEGCRVFCPATEWVGDTFGYALAIGVSNRPPTVEAGPDRTISEGSQFTSSGSFTDPNPDTWSATVDYGDGSGSQPLTLNTDRTFTLSHTYADDGTYTVTVTVTDHHGAAGTDTVTVTVNNVAPTVSAGGDQTVEEGDIVTLDPATFNDPGTLDTHTAMVEWGDGTPIETGVVSETPYGPPGSPAGVDGEVSGSHVYADNGSYTVEVCVMDDDGATTCDTLNVTVENVAPVSNIDTLTDERDNVIGVDVPVALVGLDVYLAGSFNDAGTLDTHTANISWGDETPIEPGDVTETPFGPPGSTEGMDGDVVGSRSHAYRNPGDYTITLSVIDDDGGVGTTTAPIRVADPIEATEEVIEDLISLAEDDPNVAAALDKLRGEDGGQAENGALDMLEQGNLNAALEKIKQGLQELEAAEAADPNLDLSYIEDLLALTAKSTAVEAIGQAEAVATKPNELRKIQQAKDLVAQGDTLLAAFDYVGAVDRYQRVVREVQGIH